MSSGWILTPGIGTEIACVSPLDTASIYYVASDVICLLYTELCICALLYLCFYDTLHI